MTLEKRPPRATTADFAYNALQQEAHRAKLDGNHRRAKGIREALAGIRESADEDLRALSEKFNISEPWSHQEMLQWPANIGPTVTFARTPPPAPTSNLLDWITAYRRLLDLDRRVLAIGWDIAHLEIEDAAADMVRDVMQRFRSLAETPEHLPPRLTGVTEAEQAEQAYRAIEDLFRRAADSSDDIRSDDICKALEALNSNSIRLLDELTRKYGALVLFAQTMQVPPVPPVTGTPPVAVPSTTAPPVGRLHLSVPAHPFAQAGNPAFPEPAGGLVHTTGVPGPPRASGRPETSLAEASGAAAGDPGRWWPGPPATVSGATAAEPVAIETTLTPALTGTSSLWLQPAGPAPAPSYVSFDTGLHHAGVAVQPPPVTTTASSTAPVLSPGAPFPTSPWLDDGFTVERALIAGKLPPRFDARQLIVDASLYADFGLAEELAAGRLPFQAIDALIAAYRATDEGGSNMPHIEYLLSLKESIEHALLDTYPQRADPQWLDEVQEMLGLRSDPAAPSAASTTDFAKIDAAEIDRLLGTDEGVSHLAPLPPPAAPEARRGGRLGASPHRRPVAHSTTGNVVASQTRSPSARGSTPPGLSSQVRWTPRRYALR